MLRLTNGPSLTYVASGMSLGDFTGIFSREFVVGFFLPAYAALVSLWLLASSEFVPNVVDQHSEQHSQATDLLILGATAVVLGLALSGLSYYVARLFEGYALERWSSWPIVRSAYRATIALQRRHYDRLCAIRHDESKPPNDRQLAAWKLDRYFPPTGEDLLPTRVGNTIRAFERHSNVRWGLDSVTIWPRIEALLSADERELLADSKVNFYLFVNTAIAAFVVGACLVVDQSLNAPQPASFWLLYAIPFVLAYVVYRLAIDPAAQWGDVVRSSIDLHRLELYEKLGVRAPTSFSDERELALRVNQVLLYGEPLLSDDLWRSEEAGSIEAEDDDMSRMHPGLGIAGREQGDS
jgi:hypothetical protein